jgi:hypothetical protein
VRDGQRNAFSIASLDDEVITRLLGDEASRILHSARDAAARLKAHTEEAAERMLREAGDEARRIREEAEIDAARRRSDTSADAQAELEMARQQGREMVEEAREYRERVLADVARRRELARRQIEQIVHGRARLIHKPGQVFSRIHVDDIVGALLHCLALPATDRPATLNLADQEPCPSSETLGYAAHLMGCKLPPVERFTDVASTMSPMARSFWMENRRADSRLLREQLGYQLRYPSSREGYREGCGADWEPDWGSPRDGMLRS